MRTYVYMNRKKIREKIFIALIQIYPGMSTEPCPYLANLFKVDFNLKNIFGSQYFATL